MAKWKFVRKDFNGEGELGQIGSIITPDGLWFAAIEGHCAYDETDEQLIERVIQVLNRELPNGKFRSHKKKVS